MENQEIAATIFKSGYNCSQAVFSTFAEQMGMDKEMALKVSCGFGGGMGRMQETCGAVTGAFMVISLKYGKSKIDENHLREKTYSLVKEFTKKFKVEYNSINCKELINCDLNTPEGQTYMQENKVGEKICTGCIKHSVKILDEILVE